MLLGATTNPAKKKGRKPNAPPSEAPRSARVGRYANPRPIGRWLSTAPTLKIRGFQMGRSRAALNLFQWFLFYIRFCLTNYRPVIRLPFVNASQFPARKRLHSAYFQLGCRRTTDGKARCWSANRVRLGQKGAERLPPGPLGGWMERRRF